jgi:flagella basal body P-ring formation protein FlgA
MKKGVRIVVAAFILLTSYGLAAADADTALKIVVKSNASVRGEKIYLKDIAQIKGEKNITQQIGSVCLGSASRPGNIRSLKGERILTILRSKRFWPVNATITTPETVEVTRRSQIVSKERYKDLFHRYVADLIGANADFSISNFKVTGNRPVSEGAVTLKVADNSDKKMLGYVSVTAFVGIDKKNEQRVMLSGWVNSYKKVFCTVRTLKRNEVVTENDVKLVRKNICKLPLNVVSNAKAVMGKRLKHCVRSGEYLRGDMLEEVPVVHKGDHVIIMAESSILRVTVIGKTLEEGCPGEMIKVKNSMSNKIISAQVIDASTVKVQF